MASRIGLGIGLAVAGLVSVLINTLNSVVGLYFLPLSVQTVGTLFGLVGVLLSIGAFVVSLGYRSRAISLVLIATGAIFALGALVATGYLSVIVFPGPIIGVFLGLLVLGLGVAKGIGRKKTISTKGHV
jgi:hypothetical protein